MTYKITVYDTAGKKVSTATLDANLYGDDMINHDLIHEYLLLQQSNARVAIAHTKTRGEVHGSGKKLFRQKGTGNARAGDKKSPIRKGGGVAFGPRSNRNFSVKMPQKMRRKALRGIVSAKATEGAIIGVEGLTFAQPKTKDALNVLSSLKCGDKRSLVVYAGEGAEAVKKSFANVTNVRYVSANYLNPQDMLWSQTMILSNEAIDYLNTLS